LTNADPVALELRILGECRLLEGEDGGVRRLEGSPKCSGDECQRLVDFRWGDAQIIDVCVVKALGQFSNCLIASAANVAENGRDGFNRRLRRYPWAGQLAA